MSRPPNFLEDQARTSEELLWTKVILKPNFLASCQSFDSAYLSFFVLTIVILVKVGEGMFMDCGIVAFGEDGKRPNKD